MDEEFEALQALYGEEDLKRDAKGITVQNLEPVVWMQYSQGKPNTQSINSRITITFTKDPASAPPVAISITAPWLTDDLSKVLHERANEIAKLNWPYDTALSAVIDCVINECNVTALITQHTQLNSSAPTPSPPIGEAPTPAPLEGRLLRIDPGTVSRSFRCQLPIYHGHELVDRKSVFQAHLAPVATTSEVSDVIQTLRSNNRYSRATHNMVCYRLKSFHQQDHDSDGESGAGTKMQWLMDTLRVEDVVVIVSRWYGGIQLGPDRFKHINSLTRSILEERGFVSK